MTRIRVWHSKKKNQAFCPAKINLIIKTSLLTDDRETFEFRVNKNGICNCSDFSLKENDQNIANTSILIIPDLEVQADLFPDPSTDMIEPSAKSAIKTHFDLKEGAEDLDTIIESRLLELKNKKPFSRKRLISYDSEIDEDKLKDVLEIF